MCRWKRDKLGSSRRPIVDSVKEGKRRVSVKWTCFALISIALALTVLTGCMQTRLEEIHFGELLSVNEVAAIPQFMLQSFLNLVGSEIPVRYSVKVFAVTFSSESFDGTESVESGLVILPVAQTNGECAPMPLALLSIQHGTIFTRAQSPSNFTFSLFTNNPESYTGLVAAGMGYAVVMPDYSGLGVDDSTVHLLCHARSLANSVLNMVRAGEQLLETMPTVYQWDQRLFLAGYSEGGYASLAAGRFIQQYCRKEYSVTGIASMAGPANLSSVMKDIVLEDERYPHLDFLAYLIFGYNSVYNWFEDPEEAFLPPYNDTLPLLIDGEHNEDQIRNALSNTGVGQPSSILTQRVFRELRDPGSAVYRALAQNDLHNTWVPNMPIWMAHSAEDETVPVENTRTAVNCFRSKGVSVTYVELPTGQHRESYIPAFLMALVWIESFRS